MDIRTIGAPPWRAKPLILNGAKLRLHVRHVAWRTFAPPWRAHAGRKGLPNFGDTSSLTITAPIGEDQRATVAR
jgi:hypothetical protein